MKFAVKLFLLITTPVMTVAQAENLRRYEVSVQFSSITIQEPNILPTGNFTGQPVLNNLTIGKPSRTEPGFGGRFTININSNFALEVQADFYPRDNGTRTFFTGGRTLQVVAGMKAGKRFERFGIFGKARPGIIRFSRVLDNTLLLTSDLSGVTEFAVDLGGVVEFYPSRRLVTRLDFGDTVVHHRGQTLNTSIPIPSSTGVLIPNPGTPVVPITLSGMTKNNFQFSAGVGFRF